MSSHIVDALRDWPHVTCTQCGQPTDRPDRTYCAVCRATKRVWYLRRERPRRLARREAPGRARLACCGQWRAITTVPLLVPCCGRIWFSEAGR